MMKVFKDKKGQSIVEAAMIIPIILIIFMGIFEFGRIFNTYLIITNASREGARRAAVGGADIDIINTIYATTSTLDPSAMQITITPSATNRLSGAQATIDIKYSLPLIFPVVSSIAPNPLPLEAKTVMRVE